MPANQGNNVSAPIADMCNGGLNETTLTSLNLLPRLVEQLIQGQSLLHEALSSLSDRLDNLRPLDGRPPLAVPAQASRRVTSCAPSVHPPALPPRNVAAPEANASASVNEANASTSFNEDASPEVRVCRRASCRNSVADCCRTGFCSRRCSSQRCPCNVSLAELHARPSVCRRRDCATEVAANCSTGYCPTHSRSRRCTCRGVTPDPPAQATRPTVRFCQHPDCGNEVAACNSGFCLSHCRCHACSRVRVPTPPPAPHRNAARRRVCRRPDCWVLVAPECRTGFCHQHCTSTRCNCAHAPSSSPAPPRFVPERSRCRRRGCQAFVGPGCRTGYCRNHCFNRTCCSGVSCSDSGISPAGPLQRYLSEVCTNLPVDASTLPASVRESFHALQAFASTGGSGNGRGSHRCRRDESRTC